MLCNEPSAPVIIIEDQYLQTFLHTLLLSQSQRLFGDNVCDYFNTNLSKELIEKIKLNQKYLHNSSL